MSITLLTVLVLMFGLGTYVLLNRLIRSVRIVAACVLVVFLASLILQVRQTIARLGNSSGAPGFSIFSDERTPNVPNPTGDPSRVADVTFQKISKEDHNFLDEILQKQKAQQQAKPGHIHAQNVSKAGMTASGDEPVLKAELAVNSAETKRSEATAHRETVKRAQLVTHDETFKRAELVRSRQQ